MVVSMLMQHGWDAFNANCTIKNYKSIDIVCLNSEIKETTNYPWKPASALIQVKTSVQKNIPTGFTIEDSLKHDLLKEKVMGPYVFVYVNMVNEEWKFRYFILSRSQFIELLHSAHVWYKYDWNREKEISEKSPAGIDVKWLMGEDEPETKRHKAFVNPLKGVSCEDCWENIWKD